MHVSFAFDKSLQRIHPKRTDKEGIGKERESILPTSTKSLKIQEDITQTEPVPVTKTGGN